MINADNRFFLKKAQDIKSGTEDTYKYNIKFRFVKSQ